MSTYIRWFNDLTIKDIPLVGGKNASLGEMYSKLTKKGVPVPNGFAITAAAYRFFIAENKIDKKIKEILKGLDVQNVRALHTAGEKVRALVLGGTIPKALRDEMSLAYKKLSKQAGHATIDVAVRSSATAEDLPDASFAGQQESYLNVRGEAELMDAARKCIASLFTDRAISYREAKGFDHMAIALSVGVQQMVHSDKAASGVMFTLDTESGFKGVVLINAAYGLGEYIVKGRVTPDQFYVFKEGAKKGLPAIMSHRLGSKEVKLVYGPDGKGTKQEKVKMAEQKQFCLTDKEVLQLASWGMIIEEHYDHAMDIEWAKDGGTGKLFIVQARSETVKSRQAVNVMETYKLGRRGKVIVEGTAVGQRIGHGKVRIISSPKQMKQFKAGEVLVTRITDPDWEPIMRIAGAIITEQGGKTSHAAIVSRELGIPCIVGAAKARQLMKNGEPVTASCAEGEKGFVYAGLLPFEVEKVELKKLENARTKIMMNVGDPDRAFGLAAIPNDGVGLAREEFIYTNFIKIHPMALVNYKTITDQAVKKQIDALTVGYTDKVQYAIDRLAEGIAFITAPFYPHDVIVRLSDFKTNEYATLIGGTDYEPKEENPMIGWRGASRYYDPKFKPAFKIECEAIKKVREVWGLKNLIVMVPFCRTVEEGRKVLATMKEYGLERGKNGLQVYVMCEIPANVILAKEFCEIYDGFSIGSNDLTQLTLGVDRDSALVSHVYDEKNEAVKKLIREVIHVAHQYKRKVGICGQAPSDYPEFAEFLVQQGIDSISLNPDTVLKTRQRIVAMEKKVGKVSHSRKSPLAMKLATFLGLATLSLVVAGYTCQTISNEESEQRIQQAVAEQVLAAQHAIRDAAAKEEAAKQLAARKKYTEDSFAHFVVSYPASASVSHQENTVTFSEWKNAGSADTVSGFAISYLPTTDSKHPLQSLDSSTTTIWNGFEAVRGDYKNPDEEFGSGRTTYLRIFPQGEKKSKFVIEFRADPEDFDEMLSSVTEFSLPKETNK